MSKSVLRNLNNLNNCNSLAIQASRLSNEKEFSHFDNETKAPKQVDISEKPTGHKVRVAGASGYIQLNE